MKCSKCGAEIRVGSVYCESCGEAAQIVPDYNILEDDFLVSILEEKKKVQEAQHIEDVSEEPKPKKNKKLIIALISLAVVVVALGIGIFMYRTSYSHYMNKGLAFDKKKDYTSASLQYEKAIKKDAKKAKPYILAGFDYYNLEDYDKAEEYFQKAIALDKNSVLAYKGLIQTFIAQEKFDELDTLKSSVENRKIQKIFEENMVNPPVFSEKGGKHKDDIELTLTSANGDEILYSDDGSDPSKAGNGIVYHGSETITIKEGVTTIKAVCVSDDGKFSQIVVQRYDVTYEKPDVPEVTPSGGSYTTAEPISINAPEGSTVYYTWDGSVPNESSAQYTGAIDMMEGNNILTIIVVDKHGMKSDISQYNFKYIPE